MASTTYVGLDDNALIGFYTLVGGEVAYDGAPESLTKGLARHPVPIILLARMGVRVGLQGRGPRFRHGATPCNVPDPSRWATGGERNRRNGYALDPLDG